MSWLSDDARRIKAYKICIPLCSLVIIILLIVSWWDLFKGKNEIMFWCFTAATIIVNCIVNVFYNTITYYGEKLPENKLPLGK